MELAIEKTDAAFDRTAPLFEKCFFLCRILKFPASLGRGSDRDAFLGKLSAAFVVWPVRVVSEEPALEFSLQESVKALDVVAIARDLKREGDAPTRSEDQVLSNPMEPAFQGCAVTRPGKAGEPLLLSRPDWPADIDRMGVDDEKGGSSSSSIMQKTEVSFRRSGVRRARRSAQFCLESRRGKSETMTGCLFSH